MLTTCRTILAEPARHVQYRLPAAPSQGDGDHDRSRCAFWATAAAALVVFPSTGSAANEPACHALKNSSATAEPSRAFREKLMTRWVGEMSSVCSTTLSAVRTQVQ